MHYTSLTPAPHGLMAFFLTSKGTCLRTPVICLALDDDGRPHYLVDDYGEFVDVSDPEECPFGDFLGTAIDDDHREDSASRLFKAGERRLADRKRRAAGQHTESGR